MLYELHTHYITWKGKVFNKNNVKAIYWTLAITSKSCNLGKTKENKCSEENLCANISVHSQNIFGDAKEYRHAAAVKDLNFFDEIITLKVEGAYCSMQVWRGFKDVQRWGVRWSAIEMLLHFIKERKNEGYGHGKMNIYNDNFKKTNKDNFNFILNELKVS